MKKVLQRTVCSFIFASLTAAQLQATLSHVTKKNVELSPLSTLARQKPQGKKLNFKIVQEKAVALTLRAFKKNSYHQHENNHEQNNKKSRKGKIITGASSVAAVGLFFYVNRDKFKVKINAQELPKGWGDLRRIPQIDNDDNPTIGDLPHLPRSPQFTPVIPLLFDMVGGIPYLGMLIQGAIIAIDYTTKNKGKGGGGSHHTPDGDMFASFVNHISSGNEDAARSLTGNRYEEFYKEYVKRKNEGTLYPNIFVPQPPKPEFTPPQKPTFDPGIPTGLVEGALLLDDEMKEVNTPEHFEELKKKPFFKGMSKEESEWFTWDNMSTIAGTAVREFCKITTLKIAEKAIREAFYMADKNAQYNTRKLLGMKTPPHPLAKTPKTYIEKIVRVGETYNALTEEAGNYIGQGISNIKHELYDVIAKCMLWEWKSSAECYKRHPEMIRYAIESQYSKELAQIPSLDDKINYIEKNTIIDDKTKETSITILKEIKKYNEQTEIELKKLRNVLEDTQLSETQKQNALDQFAQFSKNAPQDIGVESINEHKIEAPSCIILKYTQDISKKLDEV